MEKELLETFEAAKKAADEAVESVGKSPEAKRCVDALTNLRKIKVTTDVLVSTQVGKKLRSLTKHPNSEIKSMASDLLAFWKNIVIEESVSAKRNGTTSSSETDKSTKRIKIESRPEPIKIETKLEKPIKIESKSPKAQTPKPQTPKSQTSKPVIKEESKPFPSSPAIKKATPAPSGAPKFTSLLKCHDTNRDRMRELIADAFSRVRSESQKDEREEIQNILDEINSCDYLRAAVTVESSLYEKLGSSTGAHKVKYRSILFNLRAENNTDFRRRVLLGHVNPESLPDLSPEDMASDARRMENNKIKDKALFDCERAAAPKATTDQFKCGRCKQRKTTYYQLQTRSADEPMTTFVTCVNCNNHWKFC